jgi:hypothetical protein
MRFTFGPQEYEIRFLYSQIDGKRGVRCRISRNDYRADVVAHGTEKEFRGAAWTAYHARKNHAVTIKEAAHNE